VNASCFEPQVQATEDLIDKLDDHICGLVLQAVKRTGQPEETIRAEMQARIDGANGISSSLLELPVNVCCPITRDLKNAKWLSSSSAPQRVKERLESAKEKLAIKDIEIADLTARIASLDKITDLTTRIASLQEEIKDANEEEDKWVFNDGLLATDDDYAPTEANVIAMQRWIIGAPTTDAEHVPSFGNEIDQYLLAMPSKQVYELEYKCNVLEPEIIKKVLGQGGFHYSKDVLYQWTGTNAKERESIKEAQGITLMKAQIHTDAYAKGLRDIGIVIDGHLQICRIFSNDIECMGCGRIAKNQCTKCSYWYCTVCLEAHISKRKVGCRCNNPNCDPCKYQSRRGVPVHSLKRTRVCSNHSTDKGCHLISFDKPALDSKDVPSHGPCPGCGVAFYCSRKCQKQHWHKGGHKQRCALWAAWRLKYKEITKKNSRFKKEDTSSSLSSRK